MAATPHNLDAERALVGAMLMSSPTRARALELVCSSDIFDPDLHALFVGIEQLHARGGAVDPTTVAAHTGKSRIEVAQVLADTPSSANVAEYARIVAEMSMLRRAIMLGTDLIERAYAREGDTVRELCRDATDSLAAPVSEVSPAPELDDFLGHDYPQRWLIPNLVARRDRIVITGGEGRGKSLLCAQFGLLAASGRHPWSHREIAPCRVLLVDLENGEPDLQDRLKRLRPKVEDSYRGNLFVQCRSQGMDLTKPHDVRWLDALMAHHRPDLLIVGSLYKAFMPGARGSELAERTVAEAFDMLRVKHDCALLIEAHSPHGESGDRANFRPIGSSLWLRWPEIGLGMKPVDETVMELVRWKYRDRRRVWPARITEGGHWPWSEVDSRRLEAV